jgi:TolB-like protein
VIRGTVRVHDNLLRVTARATTADSRLLWSHQVDSLVGGTALIHLQERVALEVLTHIGQWLSGLRPENTSNGLPHSCLDLCRWH